MPAHPTLKLLKKRPEIRKLLTINEQKGYVTRIVCKRDRRAREVRLTETGRDILNDTLPVVTALQQDILPGLDTAERERFLQLAHKVVANITDAKAQDQN